MFDAQYMRKRNYLAWRAPIVCGAIKKVLNPQSVVDLGCATGDLVKGFREIGITAWGVDSAPAAKLVGVTDKIINSDFTEPEFWDSTSMNWDLVTCFEVLRFIPIAKFEYLTDQICSHSRQFLFGYVGENLPKFEKALEKNRWERLPQYEFKIRFAIQDYKTKPAIKAIYNGMQYWKPK